MREGFHLFVQELVLEQGSVPAAVGEVLDGLDLVDPFAGLTELYPAREIVAEGLVPLLDAESKRSWQAGTLVGASEVAHECIVEILPAVDAIGREATQPRSG